MQTYAQFKAKIKARLWPAGEQQSLVAAHDAAFQNAMLDLQKWVPCLKQFNVSIWETGQRHWENAKTVVNAPFGQIRRVYTVAGGTDQWRDKIYYRSGTFEQIECWARTLLHATTPINAGLPTLALGYKVEETSTDGTWGRARTGLWAVHRKRLYIAPWLQTYETLVVEWDGEKNAWQDSDGVDETYWRPDAEMAVEYFVAYRHHLHYGDRAQAPDFLKLYEKARADLMYWCRENTRAQSNLGCSSANGNAVANGLTGWTDDRTNDDDDPTDDTTDEDNVLFNAVGDMGEDTAAARLVGAAMESDSPELAIMLGDISYGSDYDDFDANFGWAIEQGIVAPVPGNHDWDIDDTLAAYKAHFADFVGNNGHNYEVTAGPIHFFVFDTDARFDDGYDVDSVQAEWLRVKLLLSTARWKVVLMHRPAFSSDATHGSDTDLQLPFAAWGADLVLAAHAHLYERLEKDGIPYINVGTGGRPLYSFGSTVSGSQVRINDAFGRLIGQANCDEMILTFKDVDGNELDSLTITKD